MRLVTITLLLSYVCSNQIITLPKFYKGEGVIFCEEKAIGFSPSGAKGRFTPTVHQVKIAETIACEKFLEVLEKDERFDPKYFQQFNYMKYYKHHNRQYVGVVDLKGDSLIYMILLNFKGHKNDNYFNGWQNELITGFGEFYEKNVAPIQVVNLTKEEFHFY